MVNWLHRNAPAENGFKNGDFDLGVEERSGQPKKIEDADSQALLDKNPAQTNKGLAMELKTKNK